MDLLPQRFKEDDTYKDSGGRGILERFLNVLGSYFQYQVVPEIDHIIDIIDVNTTPAPYTTFLWEFLGSMPFSSGLYDFSNINETDNPEEWQHMLESLPVADYRSLLKYAISLYKIRGTLQFYPILMRYYSGINNVVVHDPNGSLENPVGDNLQPLEYIAYYDDIYQYDDGTAFDETFDCNDCTLVPIDIYYDFPVDLNGEIIDRILLILNRFRPVNIQEFTRENVNFIHDVPTVVTGVKNGSLTGSWSSSNGVGGAAPGSNLVYHHMTLPDSLPTGQTSIIYYQDTITKTDASPGTLTRVALRIRWQASDSRFYMGISLNNNTYIENAEMYFAPSQHVVFILAQYEQTISSGTTTMTAHLISELEDSRTISLGSGLPGSGINLTHNIILQSNNDLVIHSHEYFMWRTRPSSSQVLWNAIIAGAWNGNIFLYGVDNYANLQENQRPYILAKWDNRLPYSLDTGTWESFLERFPSDGLEYYSTNISDLVGTMEVIETPQ